MEEQPAAESPRRRSQPRSPRRAEVTQATFAPPVEADPDQDPAPSAPAPRPRSRKAAPVVLFKPPTDPEPPAKDREQPPAKDPGQASAGAQEPPAAAATPAPAPAEPARRTAKKAAKKAAKRAARKTSEPVADAATAEPVADAAAAAGSATPRKRAAKKTSAAVSATVAGKATSAEAATGTPEPTDEAPTGKTPTAAKVPTARRAPAARKASARKPTPAGSNSPQEEVGAVVVASGRTPETGPRPSAARWIINHPGYAPELLALAAVQTLGPEAASWAARLRSTYPAATPAGLARLATRRYVRISAVGAALSVGTGVLAPFAELATLVWSQAELVLRLAAAHGHDPTDPDRAADLLVLTRIHPDQQSARTALAAATRVLDSNGGGNSNGRDGGDGTERDTDPADRIIQAAWRLGAPTLARTTGWLALRLSARLLPMPGAKALVAGLAGATATERLAARATAHYRSTTARHPT